MNLIQPNEPEYAGSFATIAIDNGFDPTKFEEELEFDIRSLDKNDLEVEIHGFDAPLANALRRIIIAEIPTVAIDKAVLYQNTSIIHDEVLCHRLGLIPIDVDPDHFIFKKPNDEFNEHNSVKFNLHVICKRKEKYASYTHEQLIDMDPEEYLTNSSVYTSDLEWEPMSGQEELFKDKPVKPLHDNILIAKLRENQEIEMELYCTKNTGRVHAKWSPVSTAFYRLKPSISFKTPIKGQDARELVDICPQGVFGVTKKKEEISIEDIYSCTMCRECLRSDKFNDAIELGKEKKKYIFTVESVGVIRPEKLFLEAIQIIKEKIAHYTKHLKSLKKGNS